MLAQIGGPIFVPGHDLFADWRVVGCGRSGADGITEAAHVDVTARGSAPNSATIETTTGCGPWGHRRLAASLRSHFSSPSDGRGSFEVPVTERSAVVEVDGRRTEVAVVAAETSWAAEITIGDRLARVVVQGVMPEDFTLHAVSSPASIPDDRFGMEPN